MMISPEWKSPLKFIAINIKEHRLSPEQLCLLPGVRDKILAYRYSGDRNRAYASELLKNYYFQKLLCVKPDAGSMTVINNRICLQGDLQGYDFNLSHCKDYVIMAAIEGTRVGVDIEYIDMNAHTEEIVETVFSDAERNYTGSSAEAFYTIWTKKESYLKAIGYGFMNESILKKTQFNLDEYQHFPFGCVISKRVFGEYRLSVTVLNGFDNCRDG